MLDVELQKVQKEANAGTKNSALIGTVWMRVKMAGAKIRGVKQPLFDAGGVPGRRKNNFTDQTVAHARVRAPHGPAAKCEVILA